MAASSLKMAVMSDYIIQKEPTLELVIRAIALVCCMLRVLETPQSPSHSMTAKTNLLK